MVEALTYLESLPVSVAILNSSGRIVAVNEVWTQFGRRNGLGLPDFGVGSSYLDHCGSGHALPSVAKDLRDLLSGQRDLLVHIYPCDSPEEKRWFLMLGFPLTPPKSNHIAILHTNISSLAPLLVVEGQMRERLAVDSRSLAAATALVQTSVSDALSSQLQVLSPNWQSETETPSAAPDKGRPKLSKRQREVLRLLGEGKTNTEIAKLLFRSPNTVKLHVSAILRELNVKSRTQAALLASEFRNQ